MVWGYRNLYRGLQASLTLTQQDGDGQGDEEQEAGARQGNPDDDVTEEVPLVGAWRKREEERSTGCSWLVLQPALVEPRDLPGIQQGWWWPTSDGHEGSAGLC